MNKTILSKSIEDYLEAIYILEINKKPLQSVLIAEELKVSKPAVNKAMNELIAFRYIEKAPYQEIIFTSEGRKKAKDVYRRHIAIRDFLIKLGVNEETANNDCCLIEHVISKETLKAIEEFNKK